MPKKTLKPGTLLFPLPAALLSVAAPGRRPNIITLAWVGIVCSNPPMLAAAIRSSRHSHAMVKEAGEFVLNIAADDMAEVVDGCGSVSGRDTDKFARFGLHAIPSEKVSSPAIDECPLALECVVRQSLPLGSHELFIAEIVSVRADEDVLAPDGQVDASKVAPLCYCPGDARYFRLGGPIAGYGFSARKR